MNLTSEDLKSHSPLVQRAMSLENANVHEFHKARMQEVRKM